MTDTTAPYSQDFEQAVLGAVLMAPSCLSRILVEEGLRPEHFYLPKHRDIFARMVSLYDADQPIDPATVAEGQNGGAAYIHSLPSAVPALGHVQHYAKRVRELDGWRRKRMAGMRIVAAANTEDREALADAEALLNDTERRRGTYSPLDLVERATERLNAETPDLFPFPFERLNTATGGGMKRGQVTLVGGWTSHGKSLWLDQCLDVVGKRCTPHLYLLEQTPDERLDRHVARATGMNVMKLARGRLTPSERADYLAAAKLIRYGMTEAAGWTVDEVAHDTRRRGYDVVAVDHIHLFDYEDERDLARISRRLNRLAKQASCHVLAGVQLNEKLATGQRLPRPGLGTIKGASALKQDADNVMFVYREQEDDGRMKDEGRIYFAKVRQGMTRGMPVAFNGDRMRWEATDEA